MTPICQLNDCSRKASYALTYGNPIRCKNHKENMKLQYEVCFCGKSRPNFNYPIEKKAGRWIYIRFNPDKYKGKNGKTKDTSLKSRLTVLKNEIDKQIERINNDINQKNEEELVERIYLYYDGYN